MKIEKEESFTSAFGGAVTTLSRIGLLAYVAIKFVEIAGYENNYERSLWSRDVVTKPSNISANYDSIQVAFNAFVERDDADDYDLRRYIRFQFAQIYYAWEDGAA